MARAPPPFAWTVAVVLLSCAVSCNALTGAADHYDTVHSRELLQSSECVSNDLRYFAGEFRPSNNNACNRCSGGRVAWCCRSDNFASPDSCKPANPSTCCSGQEFRYTYVDNDGEMDGDNLEDVWCMPSTCKTNFNVTSSPANPGMASPATPAGLPAYASNGASSGNNGPLLVISMVLLLLTMLWN